MTRVAVVVEFEQPDNYDDNWDKEGITCFYDSILNPALWNCACMILEDKLGDRYKKRQEILHSISINGQLFLDKEQE